MAFLRVGQPGTCRGFRRTGAFDLIEHRSAWTLELDPEETMRLYATFSEINARQIGRRFFPNWANCPDEFQGHVTRNMTTSLSVSRGHSDHRIWAIYAKSSLPRSRLGVSAFDAPRRLIRSPERPRSAATHA